jgi:glycosyltransferase involved in cell wall biosynthesis
MFAGALRTRPMRRTAAAHSFVAPFAWRTAEGALKSMMLVRAVHHDSTDAIPRALEACAGQFDSVHVVCWDRFGLGLSSSDEIAGVRIWRFTRSAPRRSFRLIITLMAYQLWVIRAIMRQRPLIVQALDFESALAASLACRITGAKLIYDVRDPIAHTAGFGGAIGRVVGALDLWSMYSTCAFVVPAPARVACIPRRLLRTRPVVVVRNTCHDGWSVVASEERQATGVVTVALLGHLSPSRGASCLLGMSRRLPWVKLIVAGKVRDQRLLQDVELHQSAKWLGLLSREETWRVMYRSTAVALLYDPSVPVNRMAAPNKYFEALMVGTPVLVSAGMPMAQEVEREGLGLVVPYGEPEALERALSLLRDGERVAAVRRRCREYFLAEYRIEDDLARYRSFYQDLVRCC